MPCQRREIDKDDWILLAADFLLDHLKADGRIEIFDTQYPESHLYLSGDLFPLLEAYSISNGQKYLNGARRILDYLQRNQTSSGGWTFGFLELGGERSSTIGGYGSYHELSDKVTASSAGWPMAGVRKYERITSDQSYRPMVEKAIDFLDSIWNDKWGFDDGLFRATFKDALAIVGLMSWQDTYPEAKTLLSKTIGFVTENHRCWSENDKNWFDKVSGEKTAPAAVTFTISCALLEAAGSKFVKSHIEPALKRILVSNDYNCSHEPALLSFWPYRQDRADIRSNVYLLLTMKLLDAITDSPMYLNTPRYTKVASWLETMRDNQGFFEYQNCSDGSRGSHASPAQFLIAFWVVGTYKWD